MWYDRINKDVNLFLENPGRSAFVIEDICDVGYGICDGGWGQEERCAPVKYARPVESPAGGPQSGIQQGKHFTG